MQKNSPRIQTERNFLFRNSTDKHIPLISIKQSKHQRFFKIETAGASVLFHGYINVIAVKSCFGEKIFSGSGIPIPCE